MKYKLGTPNKRFIEKLSKSVIEVDLTDEQGIVHPKVQLWQGFPEFETLTFDSVVEGDLVTKQKGEFTNTTLYAKKTYTGWKPKTSGAVEAAQVTKESVKESIDRKEAGIILSSTFRDATLIALAMYDKDFMNPEEFKKSWLEWRTWLIDQFGDAGDFMNNKPPF